MKVRFLVDDYYLIYHILHYGKGGSRDIISFKNFAWKTSKECYCFFAGRELKPQPSIHDIVKKTPAFLKTLKSSRQYRKVLAQTQEYAKYCKKQWEGNFAATYKIMKELTRLTLNKDFRVYVTHPSLKNGKHWGNNVISWGHTEDWLNYTTVYLWHEILHAYLASTDRNHAIIQLVADNELRVRLNGGRYPHFIGHKDLFPMMKQMLPYWRKYLKSKDRDINAFQKWLPSSIPINIKYKGETI